MQGQKGILQKIIRQVTSICARLLLSTVITLNQSSFVEAVQQVVAVQNESPKADTRHVGT
jgi:hypothetical protein